MKNTRVMRFVSGWSGLCVVSFVTMAGIGKLLDLPAFALNLESWSLLPQVARAVLVVTIPVIELSIGGLFLFGYRRFSMIFCVALLVGFSVVYGVQWVWGGKPSCGCLGVIAKQLRIADDAVPVFLRNGFLVAALVPSLVFQVNSVKSTTTRAETLREPSSSAARKAFTVIEVLVVISILAVLIAILLPAIGRVREKSRASASLSNLRQHTAIFSMYASDWKDTLPYFSNPRGPTTQLKCKSQDVSVESAYFSPSLFWPIGMADGYYNGRCYDRSFIPPTTRPSQIGQYLMPCVFMADPSFWTPETREWPPHQLRAIRLAEVVFPNSKCALLEKVFGIIPQQVVYTVMDERHRMAVVDGHATELNLNGVVPGYKDWYSLDRYYNMHVGGQYTYPGLHTLGGVRGRDLR